jgi:Flp pilus assembly pilin Flp
MRQTLRMRIRNLARDERGTTLAELMVGLAAGTVVMLGLTTMVVVTLHASTRVTTRVDATQRARLVLTRVIDQIHSACIAPKVPPIQKESTNSVLRFVHAPGADVSPVPILSVISLSGETLSQSDYELQEGVPPAWVFKSAPSKTTQLMTGVSPIAVTRPVFTYYGSAAGAVSALPLPTPLTELDASRAIQVSMAFKAAPKAGPGSEDATPARIQGSATLRLTAVSYNDQATSLPCQ